jgi:AraC-like DNA-binding protein
MLLSARLTGDELRDYLRRSSLPIREERVSFIRSSAVPGVECLVAWDSAYPWQVYHERYAIAACRTAAADWQYRGKSHFSRDRSNMLLEPDEVHFNTAMYKHCDFRVLFVERSVVLAAAQELGIRGVPHFRTPENEDRLLFAAAEDLCTAMEDGAAPLEQQGKLATCLQRALAFGESAVPALRLGHSRRPIERAKCYLEEHFSEPVTLAELVRLTGLSRFHLTRTFARHVGVPPHKYQTLLRVQHAAALLRRGTPPHLAAALVGFADQSHLTRQFRRCWHITPGRYARG